ncbi:RNA polymerase II elongation factor [Gaertneriomyces sp. JEL0708]|nr:RNA polymerase II elongation factor [Gaertneriomyces sp. JEL0708]
MSLSQERVRELKDHLVKALDTGKNGQVTDILNQLKAWSATADLLKKTKLGITVNAIRKSATTTDEQKEMAKALVAKWKTDVATASNGKESTRSDSLVPPTKAEKMTIDTSASRPTPPIRRSSEASTPGTGKDRSIEGDGLKVPASGDSVRDRCVGLLYSALAWDSDIDGARILSKAVAIERETFNIHSPGPTVSGEYKSRIRSLCFNLKDRSNPGLSQAILESTLAVERFAKMTTEEMASADRRREAEIARKESLNEAVSAADQSATTDMFQCGKCKQRKCKYFQMQTRSADEPMTTFVTCLACGNKWKFC